MKIDEQLQPEYLLLGRILRPHGVRGELRMQIITDYPERIASLKTVYLDADPQSDTPAPYRVCGIRFHQRYGLLQLAEIRDRNQADRLRNHYVMIDTEHAAPLEDGEVYLYQLIGMIVFNHTGEQLGVIREVLETGANDVYIIDSPHYGELLIPVHDDNLVEMNLQQRHVIVHLPDGLLPQST